jgi:hypothetical protein
MTYRNADYATLAELKRYLRIPPEDDADTIDDAELQVALTAASRAVDRNTLRAFGVESTPVARVFTAKLHDRASRRCEVRIDDLMTTTGLAVKVDLDGTLEFATVVAATDFRLSPLNAAADGRPWEVIVFNRGAVVPTGEGAVQVTATWGWTAVPATIKKATLLQASRFYKRRDAPFGVAGSPDMGSEMRLLAKVDHDVEVMLGDYRRKWGAVGS